MYLWLKSVVIPHLLPHRQDLPTVQSERVNNTMVTARGTSKDSETVSNSGYGVYTIYARTNIAVSVAQTLTTRVLILQAIRPCASDWVWLRETSFFPFFFLGAGKGSGNIYSQY